MVKEFSCPLTNKTVCETMPMVAYDASWLGNTDYIDRISPTDKVFSNSSVVKFVDDYGRSAIAIQYSVSCSENENNIDYAVALFQRYSDNAGHWVHGGHHANNRATPIGTADIAWDETLITEQSNLFSEGQCVASLKEAANVLGETHEGIDL